MQSNYQDGINHALKELSATKSISSALSVCNTLLEYMGIETKSVQDIELSKLKLPNAERYDRWFEAHPHFRGDRACFELTPKETLLDPKFYALQKRSKLFIAGSVTFSPNFEDREYTRTDPSMKVGIDFFLTPEKDAVIVVLSNKGSLRLVELSGRLTNTQREIFTLWHNVARVADKNVLHSTIWESFKLSSLNKKFYEGIANSFTSLTQHLQDIGTEKQLANQFANRLLGRLLFLWFLRKKNIINPSKEYFAINGQNDSDYYDQKLAYLFFNVLNTDISEREKIQKTKSTLFGIEKEDATLFAIDSITPYLNGGLFDQKSDGEYWTAHKPTFPTGFFRALYDHFDSFNFTTDESTPEYEQIAIDPEMLGRIFESFLATLTTETGAQAKKANGAFYTPREIVSYMCRESLRQYLYTALDAGITVKKSIDELLDRSDAEWAISGTNSKRDVIVKEDSDRIVNALRAIRVLDPAVGSGAFPMGILHKILSLSERLNPNLDAYEAKLAILKNNIYGVDIDPTAIEISRLRAWLSIIVDVKDVKKIKPLPNLDFKFVCANSLIALDEFDDRLNDNSSESISLENNLTILRDEYYATSSKVKKEKIQKEYRAHATPQLLDALSSPRIAQLRTYNPFSTSYSHTFYDPSLMHGVRVFDVVIGNPPYINVFQLAKNSSLNKELYKDKYLAARGSYDLYILFFELAINNLKDNGVLSYITPNKYISAEYADALRSLLSEKTTLLNLIDVSKASVFEAAVYPVVSIYKKGKHKTNLKLGRGVRGDDGLITIESSATPGNTDVDSINWSSLLNKNSEWMSRFDDIQKLNSYASISASFTVSDSYNIVEYVRELTPDITNYKKLIISSNINKFTVSWGQKKISYLKHPFNKPVIESIEGLPITTSRKQKLLKDKIIIAGMTKKLRAFYDDAGVYVPSIPTVIITDFKLPPKYLLALLNSTFIDLYYRYKFDSLSLAGGYLRVGVPQLSVMPVMVPDSTVRLRIEDLVDQILTIKKSDPKANTEDLENKINGLVYKLYGLSDEEIASVETQKV